MHSIAKLACAGIALLTPAGARRTNDADLTDFVDFQTFELDGTIQDMLWCGSDDENVLVQTTDGSIYRSRDRGSNWKRLKSLMAK